MKALSDRYKIWFCDVWGVVHDGYRVFDHATDVLQRHRKNGGRVVLVTNSPRSKEGVFKQLCDIGVPRDSWDEIVTSGDVTRTLITQHGGGVLFHIGPGRDHSLFDGLDVQMAGIEASKAIICTGLFKELEETPQVYFDILKQALMRKLPFICANPDKVVRKGDRLLYCAGAIAEQYSLMGGQVLMAGKPYRPIYDLAMKRAGTDNRTTALAIGDGLETDIKGAADYGLPVVLISGGINEVGGDLNSAVKRVAPNAQILAMLPELMWNRV